MKIYLAPILILIVSVNLFAQNITGNWITESTLGFTPRAYPSANTVKDKVYVMGGEGYDYNDTLDSPVIFDPSTNLWRSTQATGKYEQREDFSSVVIGNKIYVIGGFSRVSSFIDMMKIYDITTNTWSTPTPTGHFTRRYALACCVAGGKIYAFGGYDDFGVKGALNVFEVFDPSLNSWSTPVTTGIFTPRAGLCCNFIDGKIYVFGGVDSTSDHLNILEVYDTLTKSWDTPKTIGTPTGRSAISSCVLGGKMYVMGGEAGINNAFNILEVFDPSKNTWTTPITSGTFTPRYGLCSDTLNGKIYAIGGAAFQTVFNTNESFTPGPLNDVEMSTYSFDINIYPNPTNGLISIRNIPENLGSIVIVNVLGYKLREFPNPPSPEIKLDLSDYPSGIYYARIISPNSVIVKKIVHQ